MERMQFQERRKRMANITRFDPFNELVDDLFKGFLVRPLAVEGRVELPRMKVDVAEKNGAYVVTAEIPGVTKRSEEHTSELQSLRHLVCRLLLEKKNRAAPNQRSPNDRLGA